MLWLATRFVTGTNDDGTPMDLLFQPPQRRLHKTAPIKTLNTSIVGKTIPQISSLSG